MWPNAQESSEACKLDAEWLLMPQKPQEVIKIANEVLSGGGGAGGPRLPTRRCSDSGMRGRPKLVPYRQDPRGSQLKRALVREPP